MDRRYRRFLSLIMAFFMSLSMSSVSIDALAATAGTAKISDSKSEFNYSTKINDYKVIIKAEAGVFKAGTKVKIEAATESREKEIKNIIKGTDGVNGEAALTESFKIRFIYNGKDITPKDGGVEITIVPTKSFMKTANIEVKEAREKAAASGIEAVNAEGKEITSKDAIQVFEINGDKAKAIDSTIKNSGITVKPEKVGTYSFTVINPVVLNATKEEKAQNYANAMALAAEKNVVFNTEFVQKYCDYIGRSDTTKTASHALRWLLGTPQMVNDGTSEREVVSKAETITIDKASYAKLPITLRLGVYSNKTLDLGGATLVRESGNLLGTGDNPKDGAINTKSSGYETYKNIKICNGTIDGGTKSDGLIRMARTTDLTFENLKFVNVGQHAIEIAAAKKVLISKCSFSDPNYKPSQKSSGYEALSFDMTSNDKNFPGYGKKDYLPCRDVQIEDCTFSGLFRGLGSHHFKNNKYYENITVKNCTFENIRDTAVEGCGWLNCTVSGCTFNDVGYGVDFRQPTKLIDGGAYSSYTCNNVIDSNTFVLHNEGSKSTNVAIRTGGFALTKKTNGVKKGTYYVDGYTITNNSISGDNSDGISVEYARDSIISGNTIEESNGNCIQFVYSKDCKATENVAKDSKENGIYIKGSEKITLDKCTVSDAEGNSIHINKGSKNITIKNCNITGGNYGVSAIDATKKVTITGCTISKSAMYGIKLTDKSTAKKIDKNTISNTKKHAIYISNYATANSVNGNKISKVGKKSYCIYVSNHSKAKKIKGNTFKGYKKPSKAVYISVDSTGKVSK